MNLADITQVAVNSRFLYLQMVGHMASVDGNLDDSELELLTNMIHRFELSQEMEAELLKLPRLSDEQIKDGFNEIQSENLQYSFILDLIIMAMADGFLHDAERVYLAKINDWIKIPRADFHNLIYFAQTATMIEDTKNIDPMLQYVIDNFYLWARQSHINLFHQTHFAKSESVDQYLKNEL